MRAGPKGFMREHHQLVEYFSQYRRLSGVLRWAPPCLRILIFFSSVFLLGRGECHRIDGFRIFHSAWSSKARVEAGSSDTWQKTIEQVYKSTWRLCSLALYVECRRSNQNWGVEPVQKLVSCTPWKQRQSSLRIEVWIDKTKLPEFRDLENRNFSATSPEANVPSSRIGPQEVSICLIQIHLCVSSTVHKGRGVHKTNSNVAFTYFMCRV